MVGVSVGTEGDERERKKGLPSPKRRQDFVGEDGERETSRDT